MSPDKAKKIHDEIVQEALQDKEDNPSLFKHPLTITLIGMFLLAIFLGSYLAYSPISKTIESSFTSALIESDIIRIYDLELHFENNSAQDITYLYLQEQEAEFSLCLFGEKQENIYRIISFIQPTQYKRTFNQVTFQACPPQTLILFHTHPYKSCLASTQDIITLRESQKENPNMLMVIMCEPARFAVYE
ncbi:hypothetical protein HYV86_02415 [Candidatus Woesearchaeota archaeon]|nr:hypothetical protein [Candidatus Woesearchaeota archaeon]